MKRFFALLCVLAALTALCGAATAAQPAESVTLDLAEKLLVAGESFRLTATVAPKGASRNLVWASSDPSVAAVNKGAVYGKSAGTATITCTAAEDESIVASCTVTVYERVKSLTAGQQSVKLLIGNDPALGTAQLTVAIRPEDAGFQTVTWTSDKPQVATVDENGVVTAVGKGDCVITARTDDPASKANARTTVHVSYAVTELSLDKSEAVVYLNESLRIRATVGPKTAANREVRWESSDPSVAAVNKNGQVTPRTPGEAVITCTAADGSGVSASCKVTVKAHATGIKLNQTSVALVVGGSEQGARAKLVATVRPAGAEIDTVTFTSSDPKIVSVDAEGNLLALQRGNATITVRSDDPACKQTARCRVSVGRSVDSVSFAPVDGSVQKGRNFRVTATVLPKDASNKKLVWTSDDPSVLRIDGQGLIHAAGTGTATVTATAADGSGASASCTVTVVQFVTGVKLAAADPVLMAGESTYVNATVLPKDASNPEVAFYSSDEHIASVDADGNVHTYAEGTVKITAEATDGSGKSASVTLTVEPADPVKLAGVGVGVRSDSMVVLKFRNECAKRKVKEVTLEYTMFDYRGNEITGGTLSVTHTVNPGKSSSVLKSLRSAYGAEHYRFSVKRVVFHDGTEYNVPDTARRVTTWGR
ncbi:MAG: Ig-like domain-containing protein [Clostridia bacterium]|nr:Ig-like domain-containing protein [Clostridia bacterium]